MDIFYSIFKGNYEYLFFFYFKLLYILTLKLVTPLCGAFTGIILVI